MSIIAQFYPNGEFTHGVATANKRRSRLERLSDKAICERAPSLRTDINKQICAEMFQDSTPPMTEFISAQGYKYTYLRRDGSRYYYAVEPPDNLPVYVTELTHSPLRWSYLTKSTPIGLSDGANFTQTPKPPPRKEYKFTSRMARTIRNAAYLLEQRYGKDNLSFLTLTLPDLPPDGLAICASQWGRMVDQFLKWLRSRIERKGGEFHYTYCTEVQPKRLKLRNEYALHLHLLFIGKISVGNDWFITPKMARKAWVRCIKSVYPGDFKQDSLENLQKIRKSAAAYLGKYLSKSSNVHKQRTSDECVPRFLGHWGGVSRQLRGWIRLASLRLDGSTNRGECVYTITRFLSRVTSTRTVRFYKKGFIPLNGSQENGKPRGLHVGVGVLRKPLLKGGYCDLLEEIVQWWTEQGCEELLTET